MFIYTLKSVLQETTPVFIYYNKSINGFIQQDFIWNGAIKDIPDYLLNEIISAISISANHALFIEIKEGI